MVNFNLRILLWLEFIKKKTTEGKTDINKPVCVTACDGRQRKGTPEDLSRDVQTWPGLREI